MPGSWYSFNIYYYFRLKEGSPAIDKGSPDAIEKICDNYNQLYGLDLRFDFAYNKRPQGNGWDIGAYEYTGVIGIISDAISYKSSQYGIKVINGKSTIEFLIKVPENENGYVAIYNLQGKCLKQYPIKQPMLKNSFRWNISRENSCGFYLAVLKSFSGITVTKRFVLTH